MKVPRDSACLIYETFTRPIVSHSYLMICFFDLSKDMFDLLGRGLHGRKRGSQWPTWFAKIDLL